MTRMNTTRIKIAFGFLFAVWIVALGACVQACTPGQKQALRTAVDIASVACVVLHAQVENGIVQDVCVAENELAPFIKEILLQRARKMPGFVPSHDAGRPSQDTGKD